MGNYFFTSLQHRAASLSLTYHRRKREEEEKKKEKKLVLFSRRKCHPRSLEHHHLTPPELGLALIRYLYIRVCHLDKR